MLLRTAGPAQVLGLFRIQLFIHLYVEGLGANPTSCEMGTGSLSRT